MSQPPLLPTEPQYQEARRERDRLMAEPGHREHQELKKVSGGRTVRGARAVRWWENCEGGQSRKGDTIHTHIQTQCGGASCPLSKMCVSHPLQLHALMLMSQLHAPLHCWLACLPSCPGDDDPVCLPACLPFLFCCQVAEKPFPENSPYRHSAASARFTSAAAAGGGPACRPATAPSRSSRQPHSWVTPHRLTPGSPPRPACLPKRPHACLPTGLPADLLLPATACRPATACCCLF